MVIYSTIFCLICLIGVSCGFPVWADEAFDLLFIREVNPILISVPKAKTVFNFQETSELKLASTIFIRLYQKFISSQDGPACNFTPSCSRFGMACIKKYGFLRGLLLTADRLLRCNGSQAAHYDKHPLTGKYVDLVSAYSPESLTR